MNLLFQRYVFRLFDLFNIHSFFLFISQIGSALSQQRVHHKSASPTNRSGLFMVYLFESLKISIIYLFFTTHCFQTLEVKSDETSRRYAAVRAQINESSFGL